MGTYCQLYLDGYPLLDSKYGVDPIVMTLFRESDKRIFERKVCERNQLYWGVIEDDNEIETAHEYSNTVANIKQRLEVMGFSLNKAKIVSYEGTKQHLEFLRDLYTGDAGEEEEIKLLESHEFEDWIKAFQDIKARGLKQQFGRSDLPLDEDPLIRYILDSADDDHPYNFPADDPRWLIRTFIEVCPDNALVILDITDFVDEGDYKPDEAVCNEAIEMLTIDYPVNEKIIVLTEGATDKNVLEQSLALLYPHLTEYYSFMDFDISNLQGGASSLVSIIKAFAGSGIGNRIVALFDNDTSAQVALRGLGKTNIPENIQILTHPRLEIAQHYATLGPGGVIELDINGSACSIELYFGSDVLTDQNGKLVPIQWKGYDSSLCQYQGEILNKKSLQDAFFEKLARCKIDATQINNTDWEPMRLILRQMFQSFA